MDFPQAPADPSPLPHMALGGAIVLLFILIAAAIALVHWNQRRRGIDKIVEWAAGDVIALGFVLGIFAAVISFFVVGNGSSVSAATEYRDEIRSQLSSEYGVELKGENAMEDFVSGKIVRAQYEDGKIVAIALLKADSRNPEVVQANSKPLPRLTATEQK